MKRINFTILYSLFVVHFVAGQAISNYKLWNIPVNEINDLHKTEQRFNTDAEEIIVKFITSIDHKQADVKTWGCIDLFCKTIDGKWLQILAEGNCTTGDTMVCRFNNLTPHDQYVNNRQYNLYFPINSKIVWMEIAVPAKNFFKPLSVSNEQPVVIYTTAFVNNDTPNIISWTNLLSRKLDRPVFIMNLSANNKLKKWMQQTTPKLVVLDCIQAFMKPGISTAAIKNSITKAVSVIRIKKPETPVLLGEYFLASNQHTTSKSYQQYTLANKALREVFDSLLAAGAKNSYLLTNEDYTIVREKITDSLTIGETEMKHKANAYEQKIRTILNEQAGLISTTIPVTQRRDAASYDWETRHNEVLALNKKMKQKVVFIGNSITHYWGGIPAAPYARGAASWNKYFEPRHAINMGFGWDRIENVLWRVHHGELDGISPKQIVIMIGTNNLEHNTDTEIVQGLRFLVTAIQLKQPVATILLMGILPRRSMEKRITHLNKMIAETTTGINIKYADAGTLYLKENDTINEKLFSDGLHPNDAGYEKLGNFIDGLLKK